jgi:hypothetical protein
MPLPAEIPNARVLITVKTYPFPSSDHGEIVCTAGLLDGKEWIRVYPLPSSIYAEKKYTKYSWVELDLVKRQNDFRIESYIPKRGSDEPIRFLGKVGTNNQWAARKDLIQHEVFLSMKELILLSKTENKSLGTLKPKEIIGFSIEECERNWNPKQVSKLQQMSLFELDSEGHGIKKQLVRKLPYNYKYKFMSDGDDSPRELSIHDWEIGTLFWNCLKKTDGDEQEANRLVRQKYFDEFREKADILLFLGTTYEFHRRRMDNPFIITGVFYPPKTPQLSLFQQSYG